MKNSLSDKVWWTKKAKIKAERRLLNLDYYSQFLLLWYSLFLVCYSIYALVNPTENNNESVIMVALSVLVLVITLYNSNMDYKGRAMLIKKCYEELSIIEMELLAGVGVVELNKKYQSILNTTENHLERDFIKAMVDEYDNTSDKDKLTRTPILWHRVQVYFYIIRNILMFILLFISPIVVLFFLRGMK
ncbi:SLATT domain-containing protein [Morganella sp. GD04133]|uniref:SLATT domain-containing protein n=1 Tax=Morganella sp. GD04133 TaxID=2975435 RepID=UPI0024490F2C|nr:SLATT domain-containing protein [Morganella sp. GD04133]MDH0356352.1 SLATT domain-containing protein [Morganella sp. GD04133]